MGTVPVGQGRVPGSRGRRRRLMLSGQANAKKRLRDDEVAGSLEDASICFLEGSARRSAFIAKGALANYWAGYKGLSPHPKPGGGVAGLVYKG